MIEPGDVVMVIMADSAMEREGIENGEIVMLQYDNRNGLYGIKGISKDFDKAWYGWRFLNLDTILSETRISLLKEVLKNGKS